MKNFKIGRLLLIWSLISGLIICAMLLSTRRTNGAIQNQRETTNSGIRSLELAEQLQNGSDTLTYSVWRFVATGNPAFAEDYLFEWNTTKSRDTALDKLRMMGLGEEDLAPAEKAKQVSDALLEKELYAIRLVYDGRHLSNVPAMVQQVTLTPQDAALSDEDKLAKAHDFVFGLAYKEMKQEILNNIDEFNAKLSNSITQNIDAATISIDRAAIMQNVCEIVLIIWWILLLYTLYEFLVKPIRKYSNGIEGSTGSAESKVLLPMGAYETCYLAKAYNNLLEDLREKDNVLAKQNEELRKLSKIDFLTKISTRMELENYLMTLLEQSHLSKSMFSFVILDIDHFKQFNDTYGHPAGDEALITIARTLKTSLVPDQGMVARIGGEEFVAVLLNADEAQTERYANTLLQTIRKFQITLENGTETSLTASMGGYVYSGEDETTRDIYTRADKALYLAKSAGRDCYVSYKQALAKQ